MKIFTPLLLVILLLSCMGPDQAQQYIPERPSDAPGGATVMNSVSSMDISHRENYIKSQILAGNIPDFLRDKVECNFNMLDLAGDTHTVVYHVMPDYLAVGSDSDFVRIPLTPNTAQAIADSFRCFMPTPKLVDATMLRSPGRLNPIPYAPVGHNNELVSQFIRHNNDINTAMENEDIHSGELISGIKKDVVITGRLKGNRSHVAIYGWHYKNNSAIQPLYTGHIKEYVDYSHGIRLIDNDMTVDGIQMSAQDVLSDSLLYKCLTREAAPITQPYYLK